MLYSDAQKIVFNYLNIHHKTFAQHPDIQAVITHWLLNPALCPPEMTLGIFNNCRELLASKDSSKSVPSSAVSEETPPYQELFDFVFDDLPFPPPEKYDFTFIDLFAGIGGFRIAFQNVGGKCVFSSEWDKYAKKTYEANFGDVPYGDIRKIKKKSIPDHDVLLAGFPCQPFSLAGISKKRSLGRKHGFEDETQGTLFFEIKEILREKQPKAFMLENVKNLLSHDNKKTFEIIRHSLSNDLGYVIAWAIIDGAKWTPQHRERLFIIGYHPDKINILKDDIVIPLKPGHEYKYPALRDIIYEKVQGYTLGPGTWETLKRHKKHHASVGNGFGYGLHNLPIPKNAITRTMSARYHKDGAEILIAQHGSRPRKLTISEAMQLQGYDPSIFKMPVSNTQAYKQLGNSVVVPAVQACAAEIANVLKERGHGA